MTVREIALAAPATTRVFEEFGIDYCCGGRRSLDEACRTAGVPLADVEEKLDQALHVPLNDGRTDPEFRPPAELIDHILSTHHVYTTTELDRLIPLAEKVAAKHGEAHPELIEVRDLFISMAHSLKDHMRREENVLFPYILELVTSAARGSSAPLPHFATVRNPIRMMETEHDVEGQRLRCMRELTDNYTVPAGACPSYTALYAGLEELELDLHRHIHLENNVLFPAAIALESASWG